MPDMEDGTSREELVERVALMESMIAEGRRTTGRHGWIFVLWGLVYTVAMLWVVFLPWKAAAWPVCVGIAIVIHIMEKAQRKARGGSENLRSRNIEAVWRALGVSISLFVIAAIVSHHAVDRAYVGAIFFFVGMAHGASAMILRWVAQGIAAAIWWACGIAALFAATGEQVMWIFLTASFFGMILFGLYVMVGEQRRRTGVVAGHA